MDSPKTEASESDSSPRGDPPAGCGPGAALFVGGGTYMFLLFLGPALTVLVSGLETAHVDSSHTPGSVVPAFALGSMALAGVGFPLLLWLYRRVDLARPVAILVLMIAAVGVIHLQLIVTASLLGSADFGSFLSSALWAALFTSLAVPIAVMWEGGHRLRWAVAVIVVVVLLRALVDWNNHVREERERFDDVVRTLSEYPGEVALLESEEWSAVQAWNHREEYLQIDYETPEGDRIEVTTWADFATDATVDHDDLNPADVLRYGCDLDHRTCEETEKAGLSVVILRNETLPPNDLMRVAWRPGVYVEIRSREEGGLEGLRESVGLLRPAEEGDGVALAEEITGGPRL